MTPMALWQRIIYNFGEALLVGGLLWGLYRAFILRACPVGPFNDLTLIVVGLTVSILPLHPFPVITGGRPSLAATPVGRAAGLPVGATLLSPSTQQGENNLAPTQYTGGPPAPPASLAGTRALPGYLVPALRRRPTLALVIWLIAVAGVGFSLWSRLTMQPGMWWFAGLLPSALYFWFGITTRINEPLVGSVGAARGRPAAESGKTEGRPRPAPTQDTGKMPAPPDKTRADSPRSKEPPDA